MNYVPKKYTNSNVQLINKELLNNYFFYFLVEYSTFLMYNKLFYYCNIFIKYYPLITLIKSFSSATLLWLEPWKHEVTPNLQHQDHQILSPAQTYKLKNIVFILILPSR